MLKGTNLDQQWYSLFKNFNWKVNNKKCFNKVDLFLIAFALLFSKRQKNKYHDCWSVNNITYSSLLLINKEKCKRAIWWQTFWIDTHLEAVVDLILALLSLDSLKRENSLQPFFKQKMKIAVSPKNCILFNYFWVMIYAPKNN